jgi:hypothetical protein
VKDPAHARIVERGARIRRMHQDEVCIGISRLGRRSGNGEDRDKDRATRRERKKSNAARRVPRPTQQRTQVTQAKLGDHAAERSIREVVGQFAPPPRLASACCRTTGDAGTRVCGALTIRTYPTRAAQCVGMMQANVAIAISAASVTSTQPTGGSAVPHESAARSRAEARPAR